MDGFRGFYLDSTITLFISLNLDPDPDTLAHLSNQIRKVLQEDTDPYKVASCFNLWKEEDSLVLESYNR